MSSVEQRLQLNGEVASMRGLRSTFAEYPRPDRSAADVVDPEEAPRRWPLVVVAVGGNALLRAGEPIDSAHQRANLHRAAAVLAHMAVGRRLVVTHGNGPQVGMLALQSQGTATLDVLDAETQGQIGYLLAQELDNALPPDRDVVTVLTRVIVDADDPAFNDPTKPIGPVYGADEGARLSSAHRWTMAASQHGFRRVVPSPRPVDIVERATIARLVEMGTVVVCAGGGGVPVSLDEFGRLGGVEAVVDKDLTSALLAKQLGADELVILTDVAGVCERWPAPNSTIIDRATPTMLRERKFAAGSMGPKVDAACWFTESTGRPAAIGALGEGVDVLAHRAGTLVERELVLRPSSPAH